MSNIISLLNFLKQFLTELIRCIGSTLADTISLAQYDHSDSKGVMLEQKYEERSPLNFTTTSHLKLHVTYLALKSVLLPLGKVNVSI